MNGNNIINNVEAMMFPQFDNIIKVGPPMYDSIKNDWFIQYIFLYKMYLAVVVLNKMHLLFQNK
jgi:hypothetical protein